MGILDRMKGNPLDTLKIDDLTDERIMLERKERRTLADYERVSAQHQELFKKGFEVSEAERRIILRKMNELKHKKKLADLDLRKISNEIRLATNLIFTKKGKERLAASPLMKTLRGLSREQLEKFLSKVHLEDIVRENRTDEVNTELEREIGLIGEPQDDEETRRCLDIWETSDAAEADEVYKTLAKDQVAREREEELETL